MEFCKQKEKMKNCSKNVRGCFDFTEHLVVKNVQSCFDLTGI